MDVSGYIRNIPQGQKWLYEGHMLRVLRGELLVHGKVPDCKHTCKFTSAAKCHVMSYQNGFTIKFYVENNTNMRT